MKNLFAFTFELSTVNGDMISCCVFGNNYTKACEVVLCLDLPIIARDISDLDESIKEVIQCTDEEPDTKREEVR